MHQALMITVSELSAYDNCELNELSAYDNCDLNEISAYDNCELNVLIAYDNCEFGMNLRRLLVVRTIESVAVSSNKYINRNGYL